jgi:hypothetical protein
LRTGLTHASTLSPSGVNRVIVRCREKFGLASSQFSSSTRRCGHH